MGGMTMDVTLAGYEPDQETLTDSAKEHLALGHRVDAQWREWVTTGEIRKSDEHPDLFWVSSVREYMDDGAEGTKLYCQTCMKDLEVDVELDYE